MDISMLYDGYGNIQITSIQKIDEDNYILKYTFVGRATYEETAYGMVVVPYEFYVKRGDVLSFCSPGDILNQYDKLRTYDVTYKIIDLQPNYIKIEKVTDND